MMRKIAAIFLSLVLAFTGFSFAAARGTNPDMGAEIVICSGVGMATITVGPDGQPVEKTQLCPDGASIFSASFSLPVIDHPEAQLLAVIGGVNAQSLITHEHPIPAARDPPALA